MSLWDNFCDRLRPLDRPRVLEIGTRRWQEGKGDNWQEQLLATVPHAEHLGVDILNGPGVDKVADAHQLSTHFPPGSFDGFLAMFVWEHLRRPWQVAAELAKVTRQGGVGLVATHQSFPLHYYSEDYFRFSRAALAEIFSVDAGWRVLESSYSCPCRVVPVTNVFAHARDWNFEAEAWLNVDALVERV